MNRRMLYCEECGRLVEIQSQTRSETLKVKGVDITLDIDTCVCTACGNPVFVPDVDGESLKRFYREYRRRMGLLQPEEIRDIRSKYGMSQETFARVLGMGAKTIARYENGSLQDEAHNNLILLMRDRKNMYTLWDLHRERLPVCGEIAASCVDEYRTSVSSCEANTPVIDFERFKSMKERGNVYADDIYSASPDVFQA